MTASVLEDMVRRPDDPHRLQEFSTQASLTSWTLRLQKRLWFWTTSWSLRRTRSGPRCGLRRRSAAQQRPVVHHVVYDGLHRPRFPVLPKSPTSVRSSEGPVIEVWVGRGREWAMIVKEMVEEDFTPKTGIHVNMNIIPAAQADIGGSLSVILLAAATGTTPGRRSVPTLSCLWVCHP